MVMRSPNHRVVRTDGTRACYEIHNTDHTLVARHIRIDLAKGKKTFIWELPDGTKRLGGRAAKTLPLYRSETLRALKPGRHGHRHGRREGDGCRRGAGV